jgi:hypothetical protein
MFFEDRSDTERARCRAAAPPSFFLHFTRIPSSPQPTDTHPPPPQVALSLALARVLTHLLWRRALDPDMYALPVHSALMDLSGQLLLVSCFELAGLFGLKVTAKKHGRTQGGG